MTNKEIKFNIGDLVTLNPLFAYENSDIPFGVVINKYISFTDKVTKDNKTTYDVYWFNNEGKKRPIKGWNISLVPLKL